MCSGGRGRDVGRLKGGEEGWGRGGGGGEWC